VVKAHKERRKTNKDAIMTMVVKESGVNHRTRSKGDSAVFVMDSETSELLHYEPVNAYPKKEVVRIPRELLAEHPELDIRNDLIDCCIDVCSVDVPPLFQDNFDYLDLRRDFVHGVLTSDLLMKNIHCYVVKEGYAARVKDTKTYDAVSKDILSRWTFPLVPDDNHPGGHVYEHRRGNKYIAKDNTVVLSRTCKIGNNTLIGASTQVYDNASVAASVIGQNCIIGVGTVIKGSYIFDGTVIGPNCVVEQSIIGAGVRIRENTTVQKGCLLGDGVVVGPNVKIEPFERLSRKPGWQSEDEADDEDNNDEDEGEEDDDEGSTEEDTELDSDIEEVEKRRRIFLLSYAVYACAYIDGLLFFLSVQSSFKVSLGKESNALIWPRGPVLEEDESEEEQGPESFANQRFMRIGEISF
jgi:translation initiation factor eIF-2B subunit epsilon